MTKRKVLVVDDKEINRQSASLLKEAGYEVATAENLAEATELLGLEDPFFPIDREFRSDYFAVLTDLMMPIGYHKKSACDCGMDIETTAGYPMAIIASIIGVSNIAILTDMNHHQSQDAAVFDMFQFKTGNHDRRGIRPVYRLNESRFMLLDERDVTSAYARKDGKFDGQEAYDCNTIGKINDKKIREDFDAFNARIKELDNARYITGVYGYALKAKNWGAVLERLLSD